MGQDQYNRIDNLVTDGISQSHDSANIAKDSISSNLMLQEVVAVKHIYYSEPHFSLNLDSLLSQNRVLAADSTKVVSTKPIGFEGEKMPLTMDHSFGVEVLFIVCLLLTTSALSLGYRLYLQLFRGMFNIKQRSGYFYENTVVGLEFKVLLSIQVILLEGLIVYEFLRTLVFQDGLHEDFLFGVGCFMLLMFVYHFYQVFVLGFLGSLFSSSKAFGQYISENFTMLSFWGVILFPIALSFVYLHIEPLWVFIFIVALILFGRVFMVSKAIKIFFAKRRGYLYIILYLCALEIAPIFVLFQAMIYIYFKLQ